MANKAKVLYKVCNNLLELIELNEKEKALEACKSDLQNYVNAEYESNSAVQKELAKSINRLKLCKKKLLVKLDSSEANLDQSLWKDLLEILDKRIQELIKRKEIFR